MTRSGSPRVEGYAVLAGIGLVAALALHRPELAIFAAPFALLLAVGTRVARDPRVSVDVAFDEERTVEGVDVHVTATLRAERAVAQYSPGHCLSVSYIIDLPFGSKAKFLSDAGPWLNAAVGGWRLSGISRFQQGTRFSDTQAGGPNNDGAREERPDRVGSGDLPSSERSVDRWFATEHFSAPPSYTFGNAGRNVLWLAHELVNCRH